jgi:hypothetical protein
MRKIVQNINGRNWRALDYFRILENKNKLQAQNEMMSHNISVRL